MGWNPFRVFKKNRKLSGDLIKWAASDKYLYNEKIPEDPDDSLALTKALLKKAGYKFCRRKGTFEHGRKFTMTLRRRIALSANWDKYSTAKQAEILWHELVHVRQRKSWGHAKFLRRYVTAEGRWLIEVPAYRESIRAKKALEDYDSGKVKKYIEFKVGSLWKNYKLGRLHKDQYEKETEEIWMKEA